MPDTIYSDRLIIVIPVNRKSQAENLMDQVDPTSSGEVFVARLSPTGTLPVTHYWCSWQMTAGQRTMVQSRMAQAEAAGWAWVYDAATWTPEAVMVDRGLQPIPNVWG